MSREKIFKQDFMDIILEEEKILYDDKFMFIFSGKTYKLKLDNIKKIQNFKYYNKTQNITNSFETNMVNIFKEYKTLLVLAKKIIINFIIESRKFELYERKNIFLNTILYFKNKYFSGKNMFVIYTDLKTKEKINIDTIKKKLLIDCVEYNAKIDLNISFILLFNHHVAVYNYDSYIKHFIGVYNKIIKLPLSDNIICIDVRTDYYLELIFDMINVLRFYYEETILIKTKFNYRYNFKLVLKKKINKYNKKHKITFNNNLYRLYEKPLLTEYIDFMNKIYKYYSLTIKTIMYINTLNEDYKKLILEKIKIYREANDEILNNQIENTIY
ncbi:hypothetical protein Hokovirus_1_157 [Hokovirus HKV1]|uniref:Uncharacterized protein n=1 Tax=Hokovirus HKV1 TaxID=1977638 RepID=A0A1V0SF61_9VIRU|nr:hypothetical protein Hokovirus_1_157 [Hokovirus HKV1]